MGGEAGIGKTHLLEHFGAIARTDGVRVLTGACIEFGGRGVAFAPFVEALRGLVRALEPGRVPAVWDPPAADSHASCQSSTSAPPD